MGSGAAFGGNEQRSASRRRQTGWPSSEVAAINAARIAGKSDEEIRELVLKLEAARKWAS